MRRFLRNLEQPVLTVGNLWVAFRTRAGLLPAVRGLDLEVSRGETVALVGESGCGKSVTALSIMRLLPPTAEITQGSIRVDGVEILDLPPARLREWRGRKVAYVFQEPGSALNPVFRIGHQVAESVRRADPGVDPRPVIRELLTLTGLSDPDRVAASYPHQLSGGMQQRVMLAMSLAGRPDLLIADEPTTALDVSVQAQILRLLRDLQVRFHLSILLITHNLGVVAQAADRMVVMYGGQMVERGRVGAVLARPRHPYTRALLDAVPTLRGQRTRLAAIEGQIPAADRMPTGCAFAPRCGQTAEICGTTRPAPTAFGGEWVVRCHCLKSEM